MTSEEPKDDAMVAAVDDAQDGTGSDGASTEENKDAKSIVIPQSTDTTDSLGVEKPQDCESGDICDQTTRPELLDAASQPLPSDDSPGAVCDEASAETAQIASADNLVDDSPAVTSNNEEANSSSAYASASQSSSNPSPATSNTNASAGNSNDDEDDDDISRKAAVTLAAVAAAASSKHKSPAEAAREARLVAQTFLRANANNDGSERGGGGNASGEGGGASGGGDGISSGHGNRAGAGNKQHVGPPKPITLYIQWKFLEKALETKLQELRQNKQHHQNNTLPTLQRLVLQGENSAFLQYLLLLENVVIISDDDDDGRGGDIDVGDEQLEPPSLVDSETDDDDDEPSDTATKSKQRSTDESDEILNEEEERIKGQQSCDRVMSLLKKMETAYDSLLDLLPTNYSKQKQYTESPNIADSDDYETPIVVPDLLPPCTSAAGDATLAFFRACVGHDDSATGLLSSSVGGGHHQQHSDHQGSQTGTASTDSTVDQSNQEAPHSPVRHGSFLGGMFKRSMESANLSSSSAHKTSLPSMTNVSSSLSSVFRKKSLRNVKSMGDDNHVGGSSGSSSGGGTPGRSHGDDHETQSHSSGEYPVKIEREMLGLTVENVLERTVVRTVLPGGPAKKAGAKVGSLIVKVSNVETKNLTHFETIDELRQSQRPLVLVLKQVSDDALRAAREEMGRLIRGHGFGTIMDGQLLSSMNRAFPGDGNMGSGGGSVSTTGGGDEEDGRPIIEADLRIDAFTTLLRRRLAEATQTPLSAKNKKDEGVSRIGDKLIWILTLFCIGLEREAARLALLAGDSVDPLASPRRQRHSLYSHTAHDYDDAAKSVSKVLLDYTRKKVDPQQRRLSANNNQSGRIRAAGLLQHSLEAVGAGVRRRGGKAGVPHPPSMAGRGATKDDTSMPHEKPLLQIGDVLQRTRTFLADTASPPAALLRGELIAFLCDVLDIDTEMELSEEESVSAVAGGGGGGGKAGMVIDLGSAGSLLKLMVLNCPIMRSPSCEDILKQHETLDPDLEQELRRRFGPRENFSALDIHRLHAGNRFLSVVHRLAASRSTSARITACSLGPVLWGHLDFPHQLQLRGVITRALHDVEVLVRKSTATVLHEIAELVFDRRSVPWLVLMCERAMTDPEPQLRSAAMTLTWHLAEHLPNAFLGNASQGSRYLRRLPNRDDPIFADVYLLQCKLLPVATRLAEDRSPSVRLAVAAQCDRLCDALGDHWSSVIIDVLLALLSDSDDRVRCEAVSCVPRLAEIVLLSVSPGEVAVSEVSILEALVPASMKLQKDPSSSVRIALATAAGELLALLVALQSRTDDAVQLGDPTSPERAEPEGSKKYKRQVDDRLIPLVQTLLNDKDPEVTSAALRAVTNATRSSVQQNRQRHMSVASVEDDSVSLSSYQSHTSDNRSIITPVLSEKQVLRLLPTLTELAGSRQWRVRQSAVEIVPALLGCTQKLETRSEISKLCVSLMSDRVDAVRKTAAECLCMGGSSLGTHGNEDASADWITTIVIPSIRKCALHPDSKQRLLSLKMIEVILLNGACPPRWKRDSVDKDRIADTPTRELAVIALSLTSDRIANVRLNVGRVLESVLHVFEEEDLSFIKEVLTTQLETEKERPGGGDRDVLYFAQRCVNRAKTVLDDRIVNDEVSSTTDDVSLKE